MSETQQTEGITLDQLKESKEAEAIQKCADLWNSISAIPDLPIYDKTALNEAIHRIQDLMYTRLFIMQNGSL